jgi:hypothetical protein
MGVAYTRKGGLKRGADGTDGADGVGRGKVFIFYGVGGAGEGNFFMAAPVAPVAPVAVF